MLSREDNALISQVHPGTPMGELLRRFWIPGLISTQLPEADGPPVRLRLLGEDLVAFRDTSGAIGVKSASTSNGRFLYNAAFTPWVAAVPSSIV